MSKIAFTAERKSSIVTFTGKHERVTYYKFMDDGLAYENHWRADSSGKVWNYIGDWFWDEHTHAVVVCQEGDPQGAKAHQEWTVAYKSHLNKQMMQ